MIYRAKYNFRDISFFVRSLHVVRCLYLVQPSHHTLYRGKRFVDSSKISLKCIQ